MNISNLEVPPPQDQRVLVDATDKDAEFLSLRLLNKRSRVRLSPESLDLQAIPGKCQLFSVANSKGWFVAVVRSASADMSLVFSPLADLRGAFSAAAPDNADSVFKPQRSLSFAPATPHMLTFASADTRLIVGLVQGPVLVFDTAKLFSAGSEEIPPLHSFPSTSSSPPRQILANPGDIPNLVAILRDGDGSTGTQLVEIVDVQTLESVGGWRSGDAPDAKPTTLSWSPKGKQIAVGLQSGDIITFSPTETGNPKFVYGRPANVGNQSIIAATWLSNPSIHTIYAQPGPLDPECEQTHMILSLDHKHGKSLDTKLNTPYYPSPGLRPPGSFMAVLRNWDPTKFIIFVGDSTSSDIGVIGSDGEDAWHNYSLEETSTPSLPLDKDMNDTILVALELDLTSTESYQNSAGGEKSDLPAPPIMYAYASDGTVLGWYVVNSQGSAYPGMMSSKLQLSAPAMGSAISSNDMQMLAASAPITPVAGPGSAFGQAAQPAFGQSTSPGFFGSSAPSNAAFGSSNVPSAFGSKSPFGQTAQPSGFGQTSTFGQTSSTSPFSQSPATSPVNQTTSTSPFSSGASSGGFGAFANATPAKFGQTGFGFGTAAPQPISSTPAPNTTTEESMADDNPSFGGMSLGGSDDSSKPSTTPFGSGSNMFGQGNLTPAGSGENKPSGFGGGFNVIKPATGFGAFSNLTTQQGAFGSGAKDTTESPKAASAFGKSGFETKASGAFGSTGFGQPSFGQTGFAPASGSAFGKPSLGAAVAEPSSGGFGSFASGPSSFSTAVSQKSAGVTPDASAAKGFGSFGQGGPSAFSQAASQSSAEKPAWATSGNALQPAAAKSVFSGGSAFDAPAGQKSAFGNSSSGAFGQSTGASVFGKPIEQPKNTDSLSTFKALPSTAAHSTPTLASPVSSPASSPETSPQQRSTNIALSPTSNDSPPSSAFKSTTPAPTAGAFGQLKASSTGFLKPAQGFGFGGVVNKDSPFFNPPKEVGTKPVSVFGTQSTTPAGTPQKPASAGPVFGSTSAVGANKSVFSSPTPVATTPTIPAPTSGGFASFSNKGGFGAFSGAKTASFGELLRGGEESRDPSKPSKSVFGSSTPPPNDIKKIAEDKLQAPSLSSEDAKHDQSPSKPSTTKSGGTSSLASSQASSFVDVTAPHDSGDESPGEDGDKANNSGSELDDDDNQSFLSENFSSEGSADEYLPGEEDEGDEEDDNTEDEEDEAEGVENGEAGQAVDKAGNVPSRTDSPGRGKSESSAPSSSRTSSRSPSTTPQPEQRGAALSVSHPSNTPSIFSTAATPTKLTGLASTTPPGSPEVEPDVLTTPVATPSASTPPIFTLGLGRPSTRPTRSSPLASAPLSPAAEAVSTKAAASKSEPSLVPQPAQPRTPFGMPMKSPPIQPTTGESAEPKRTGTPPLLSANPSSTVTAKSAPTAHLPVPANKLFDAPRTNTASSVPSGPLVKPTTSPGNVFGSPVTASNSPGFFAKPATPPTVVTSASNPFSGLPPKPMMSPMPNLFGSSTAGATADPSKTPNFFGAKGGFALDQKPAGSTDHAAQSKPGIPVPASPVPTTETPGQGMQAQCALLYNHLTKELEQLRQYAEQAKTNRIRLSKPSGLSHHKDNLSDSANWTLGDVQTWGQVLKTLQSDIELLHDNRRGISQSIRELESSMLRAGTKREEIARFNKAKSDPEFGKMLKVRTLGPEHMETQSQLRRDIRTMRDRVQKLEDHLAASKKKLDQIKRGKPGLRPPSLDTINRTYRNIDIAVEHQADQIAHITSRMKKLKTTHIVSRSNARDQRLPDPRRPYNTAPSVVVNAANALNGEVSAQRLKRALLSARQQPLLNTKADSAPAAPLAFATPQKSFGIKEESTTPSLGYGFDSFSASEEPWNPASFDESPLQDLGPRRRMMGGSRHGPSPKLKKLPASSPSPSGSPAPSFDWGPLPIVTPAKTLPFGFNLSTPK